MASKRHHQMKEANKHKFAYSSTIINENHVIYVIKIK
jgi:hypothetical protein